METRNSFTEGNLTGQIIAYSVPVLLAALFQELYNITNSYIVGNYISLEALSVVSACTWICNIFNYTFYGLGMGAGILIGNYYGAKDQKNLKQALDTSLVFAVAGGLILTLAAELFLPTLMHWCNISEALFADGLAYLRVYLLGNTAVITYQMCFFILRSFGDSRHPLYFLILSCFINLILGTVFVRVLGMNVIGTSLATIIAQYVVDVLSLRLLLNLDEQLRFDIHNIDFSMNMVGRICALGIPAGIQNMLIAFSSMLVQSYVNMFPNEVIAGIGVAEKVASWAQMPSVALSSACMIMVSQNYGAKNFERVRETVKKILWISTVLTIAAGTLIFLLAGPIVSLINKNTEVHTYAVNMIHMVLFSYFFLNLSHIYNAACRGCGNVRIPMFIAVAGQVISKYLFVFIGLKIHFDVHVLYLGSAVGYSVAGILAALYYNFGAWTKKHSLRV